MNNNKTVGIAYSLSPNQNLLAGWISRLGYNVVFITPNQRLKVDMLLVYTDLDFNSQRIASMGLPVDSKTDSWLDQFMWSETLQWYIDEKIPILAIDKGVFYLKDTFGGIVTYYNPFRITKVAVWTLDSKIRYPMKLKDLSMYMQVDRDKSQVHDEGPIDICYRVRGKDIQGIQVPLEDSYVYIQRYLMLYLSDNDNNESPSNNENGKEEQSSPPPSGIPPRAGRKTNS